MKNTAKTLLLFLYFILFANLSFAKTPEKGIMEGFEAKKIAEHTWVILGPTAQPNPENRGFMNNPAFVITDKSVLVFDPGSSVQVGRALVKKIKKLTDKPITHIFDSHVHGDHWLGNQGVQESFPDVQIFAHPEMIKEAKEGEADVWLSLMKRVTNGATEGTKAVFPNVALKDGQEITVDGITIKAYLNKKAHTKTDAMYQIIQDKVLITGDNAFNMRMPRLDDGSYIGNMKVMDKALALDVNVIIPGHGPNGGKEILSNFKRFLTIVYSTSKELLDDDMEAFEMKPIIVEKLKDYQQWDNFNGAIGKLISVAAIEAENE